MSCICECLQRLKQCHLHRLKSTTPTPHKYEISGICAAWVGLAVSQTAITENHPLVTLPFSFLRFLVQSHKWCCHLRDLSFSRHHAACYPREVWSSVASGEETFPVNLNQPSALAITIHHLGRGVFSVPPSQAEIM